ncbi:hypothetical protein [Brumimicrobium oceani]|uniref:Uncharacterized protein n=1 Tax=Brumimicrobium oceani TaxID=2100725 RepID=A0A2U2XBE0_9FLAO|nr:hypothetical protein [Brumimicrobium oceani]PWH85115.1 hypothetical protein DIT68_10795 [Brumimicrobium oceani]
MRTHLLFICLFLFPILVFSQKSVSFVSLVDQLNKELIHYSKLSPFGEEYISISEFDLSRKQRKELLKEADYDAVLSIKKDSIQQFHMIFYYQDRILAQLDQLLEHQDFEKYDIIKMISGDELAIVKSADNKLYNFSIDEKTGGSYRSRFSIMHYTDLEIRDSIDVDSYSIFEGDGYNEIFTLNTEEGVKYVLTGSVRGCSYCFQTFVQLVSFQNNAFYMDFEYEVNNRDWNDGAYYDHESKTINVSYHIDDLTEFCGCEEDNERYFDYDKYNRNQAAILCQCKFVFNGANFEMVKDSWEKLMPEEE